MVWHRSAATARCNGSTSHATDKGGLLVGVSFGQPQGQFAREAMMSACFLTGIQASASEAGEP